MVKLLDRNSFNSSRRNGVAVFKKEADNEGDSVRLSFMFIGSKSFVENKQQEVRNGLGRDAEINRPFRDYPHDGLAEIINGSYCTIMYNTSESGGSMRAPWNQDPLKYRETTDPDFGWMMGDKEALDYARRAFMRRDYL